jgi:MurNAc alpha-1-phosphate uridylyltransferase
MKIKKGMILAAGLGTRLKPITIKTPKPLIKIGKESLIEKAMNLLINHGVEEIVINVHHLADQIEEFIRNKKYKINVVISNEREKLLDTGGGVQKGTKSFKDQPFVVLNPDTLWVSAYKNELILLEEMYFKSKKTCLLLVEKNLSLDSSFEGDFNFINNNIIGRQKNNKYIYTGLQILDNSAFNLIEKEKFSMNQVWNKLSQSENLCGLSSGLKFYHINSRTMLDKINNLHIID